MNESSQRVLLVEDDPNTAFTVSDALREAGYDVECAVDGVRAVEAGSASPFQVILLDVMLPGKDGFTVCRELRARQVRAPILMMSARGTTGDRVEGLRIGADDYLAKPFAVEELLARVAALVRRVDMEQDRSLARYRFGETTVDLVHGKLVRRGEVTWLSSKETGLLRYLIGRRGVAQTRDDLLREVWGYRSTSTRTVDMHVAMVRQKIEADPRNPQHLLTIHGTGYVFRD